MADLSRRSFLLGTSAVAAGVMAGGPFQGFLARAAGATGTSSGYGPIGPVPDERDGQVRLDLPAGFKYRTFHTTGTPIEGDRLLLPARHDGMAAFRGSRRGTTLLVRNHEINGNRPNGAFAGTSPPPYDSGALGGTVSVEVDGKGNVLRDWVSLNGTQMNCAGGRTPWGSWLTCEETVNGPLVGADFTNVANTNLTRNHGYVFDVPANGISDAVPIKAAGRFPHEAAAVDPRSGHVYLTEDNFGFPSGFYRYRPPRHPSSAGRLLDGGRLEMLAVKGGDNINLALHQETGVTYNVRWVPIANPDPNMDGLTNNQALVLVGDQGRAGGAAQFSRLEGCYFDKDNIWFTSTQGGATNPADPALPPGGFGNGRGQVWRYCIPARTLTMAYESPGAATLDLPDNVVAAQSGTLVLCEDGGADNFLRGLTPKGELFDFARNADLGVPTPPSQFGQEFAGATFSPDHRTLFVNIQSSSGYSIAIWGPWWNGPLW